MRREFLDHVQTYDDAARSHTSFPFAGGHTAARAELNNVALVPTAETWFSSQWRPDDEFETDRDKAAAYEVPRLRELQDQESRVTAVEKAEAIAPLLDFEIGPRPAVHYDRVSEELRIPDW